MTLTHGADTEALRRSAGTLDRLAQRGTTAGNDVARAGARLRDAWQGPGVSFDQDPAPETEAGCQAPFDRLGGVSRSYLGGASTDDFDHSRWPQVEQVAEAVMRQHGFTADKVVIADDAEYHKVSGFDEYGSDFSVSAEVRVASSIVGACVLP